MPANLLVGVVTYIAAHIAICVFWSSASVWFCGCSARCRGCKLTTEPQRPKERLCEQSSIRSILYSKPFRIIKEKIKYYFLSEHECIAVDEYEIFLIVIIHLFFRFFGKI